MLPFSAFVWPLSDPLTATGISPLARIPCPDELPLLIRLKYLPLPGRWTQLATVGLASKKSRSSVPSRVR